MSECRSVKRYTVKPLPKNLADMGRITGRTDKSYKKMIDVIAELCEDAGRLSDESWAKYDDSEGKSDTYFSLSFILINRK
jgi:hypothetical protein